MLLLIIAILSSGIGLGNSRHLGQNLAVVSENMINPTDSTSTGINTSGVHTLDNATVKNINFTEEISNISNEQLPATFHEGFENFETETENQNRSIIIVVVGNNNLPANSGEKQPSGEVVIKEEKENQNLDASAEAVSNVEEKTAVLPTTSANIEDEKQLTVRSGGIEASRTLSATSPLEVNESKIIDKDSDQSERSAIISTKSVQKVSTSSLETNESKILDKDSVQSKESAIISTKSVKEVSTTLLGTNSLETNASKLHEESLVHLEDTAITPENSVEDSSKTLLVTHSLETNASKILEEGLTHSEKTAIIAPKSVEEVSRTLPVTNSLESNASTILEKGAVRILTKSVEETSGPLPATNFLELNASKILEEGSAFSEDNVTTKPLNETPKTLPATIFLETNAPKILEEGSVHLEDIVIIPTKSVEETSRTLPTTISLETNASEVIEKDTATISTKPVDETSRTLPALSSVIVAANSVEEVSRTLPTTNSLNASTILEERDVTIPAKPVEETSRTLSITNFLETNAPEIVGEGSVHLEGTVIIPTKPVEETSRTLPTTNSLETNASEVIEEGSATIPTKSVEETSGTLLASSSLETNAPKFLEESLVHSEGTSITPTNSVEEVLRTLPATSSLETNSSKILDEDSNINAEIAIDERMNNENLSKITNLTLSLGDEVSDSSEETDDKTQESGALKTIDSNDSDADSEESDSERNEFEINNKLPKTIDSSIENVCREKYLTSTGLPIIQNQNVENTSDELDLNGSPDIVALPTEHIAVEEKIIKNTVDKILTFRAADPSAHSEIVSPVKEEVKHLKLNEIKSEIPLGFGVDMRPASQLRFNSSDEDKSHVVESVQTDHGIESTRLLVPTASTDEHPDILDESLEKETISVVKQVDEITSSVKNIVSSTILEKTGDLADLSVPIVETENAEDRSEVALSGENKNTSITEQSKTIQDTEGAGLASTSTIGSHVDSSQDIEIPMVEARNFENLERNVGATGILSEISTTLPLVNSLSSKIDDTIPAAKEEIETAGNLRGVEPNRVQISTPPSVEPLENLSPSASATDEINHKDNSNISQQKAVETALPSVTHLTVEITTRPLDVQPPNAAVEDLIEKVMETLNPPEELEELLEKEIEESMGIFPKQSNHEEIRSEELAEKRGEDDSKYLDEDDAAISNDILSPTNDIYNLSPLPLRAAEIILEQSTDASNVSPPILLRLDTPVDAEVVDDVVLGNVTADEGGHLNVTLKQNVEKLEADVPVETSNNEIAAVIIAEERDIPDASLPNVLTRNNLVQENEQEDAIDLITPTEKSLELPVQQQTDGPLASHVKKENHVNTPAETETLEVLSLQQEKRQLQEVGSESHLKSIYPLDKTENQLNNEPEEIKYQTAFRGRSMEEDLIPQSYHLEAPNFLPTKVEFDSVGLPPEHADSKLLNSKSQAHHHEEDRSHIQGSIDLEGSSTNVVEAIVEAAELTTEMHRFIMTFRPPVAANDEVPVSSTPASRTTVDFELVEPAFIAAKSESYQQPASVSLTVIIIVICATATFLIVALLLTFGVKMRNQHGTLNIEMAEQQTNGHVTIPVTTDS